ncbi:hypothetical protein AVEN_237287-1 [Araneus ventricosus]|uniref:Uncharacterized protein n=1 Tax=Araneus ventricosus TaxID=182803 RepID=A0A4Y2DKE3_ARAVE|nr:hypothetical protein AVEN_237287-1 [Araneus ventricosus]
MSEVNGLKNICLFLVTVYVKSWLESSSAIGVPLNDLMFLKKLKKYENINQGISSIALKKFCNHLWYLNEESSILAIFDKNVNIASKERIIENLKRENLHTERKCIVQPNEVPFLLAERGVKLMQDFNGLLTVDEEQKQFLLQCVEVHRKQYPDCKKATLKRKFD